MKAAELGDRRKEAARMNEHAGRALDERFHDARSDLVRAARQLALEPSERLATVGSGRARHRDALHEQRTEHAMEEIDPSDSDGAERVTVIRVAEPDELLLRAPAAKLPVLERLLERDLDRGRSRVRIEHARETCRRDVDERGRETDPRLVGQTEERRVRELRRLICERSIEHRMAMTMDVAPQRAHAIEISATILVDQERALTARDHERRPLRLLRERMPEDTLIEVNELAHGRPDCRIASASNCPAVSTCWTECPAERLNRSRAVPTGTVGGRMPWTSTRCSSNRAESRITSRSSPTGIGAIALSGAPPAAGTRPRSIRAWRDSMRRRSSPSAPRTISSAARVAAGIAAGNAVENTNGRARFHSRSAIARVAAAN